MQSLRRVSAWATAATFALAILATTACSPALNWREVPIEGLVALLPCKPDHATRTVQLGSQNTVLQMSGCEAGGALYAISHVHIADAAQVGATQVAWRQSTLANLRASAVQTQSLPLAKLVPGKAQARAIGGTPGSAAPSDTAAFNLEKMDGKRPDGTAVQARLAWLTKGQDIYHVAVYGTKLDQEEMSELLFSELRLQ
nr:hypothetical protein [Rhodoferax sp.]